MQRILEQGLARALALMLLWSTASRARIAGTGTGVARQPFGITLDGAAASGSTLPTASAVRSHDHHVTLAADI